LTGTRESANVSPLAGLFGQAPSDLGFVHRRVAFAMLRRISTKLRTWSLEASLAKQRRARARPAPRRTTTPPVRRRTQPSSAPSHAPNPSTPAASRVVPAVERTTYIEAVALYERGLQALQRHDYIRAAELLRAVLASYPDEKELHDRAQLYLNICERQSAPRHTASPENAEQRLYAATLALNSGEYAQALAHIGGVIRDEPDNDHAHYMRAVAFTLRGETSEALLSLVRALELNPQNRALARQDPDLEALRHEAGFRQVFDAAAPASRHERRRQASRGRLSR